MPYFDIPIIFIVKGETEDAAARALIDKLVLRPDDINDPETGIDSWHWPNHPDNDPENPAYVPVAKIDDWREAPTYASALYQAVKDHKADGHTIYPEDAIKVFDKWTNRDYESVGYALFDRIRESLDDICCKDGGCPDD